MQTSRATFVSRALLGLVLSAAMALGAVGVASASTNVQFSGKVTAYTPAAGATDGTISLTDRAGASLTYTVTSSSTITQIDGSGDPLSVGDHATVDAASTAPTVAVSVFFKATAPLTFTGLITSYTAAAGTTPGSITLLKRSGATLTYSTTLSTTITESGGSGDAILVDDHATVDAVAASPTVATVITFVPRPPVKFAGRIFAYTAAAGATNGSITLVNGASASLTYSVTSTTNITETGGTGLTPTVGDHAVVAAQVSAKTIAISITFNPPPSGTFSGYVTAYTAATTSSPGSITLEKKNDTTATFSTTVSTNITEYGGTGHTPTIGDHATVTTDAASPTVAASLSFTVEPPMVMFSGYVTAYTAPSGTIDGSITVGKLDGAVLTYATKLSTTITEVNGTGDQLTLGDFVTVRASTSAKTVATSISFTPAPPISFTGVVTAYSPATGSTNGSIIVKDHAGASLTFSTTSLTALIEVGGTGDSLMVADQVTVSAAASTTTIATSITFSPAPPIHFGGEVTAYTAATSTTQGSITVTDAANATLTIITTTATVIAQVGGTGATLSVGDHVNVTLSPATPTVAETIAFTSV
jgi:hypothetical protein